MDPEDPELRDPITCIECKKTATTQRKAYKWFRTLKDTKCKECNPKRNVECGRCGVVAKYKEDEDSQFCPGEGTRNRVCLACDKKERQRKEEASKREREQEHEDEEEEEEREDAPKVLSYQEVNYETLFSDEVVDAAFQLHATSHGPHYVRVAEQLLRLAHGPPRRCNVFLRVKEELPVLFTAKDSEWIVGDGSDQSLCKGKGILRAIFTTHFHHSSLPPERFNVAIYDAIQKGIVRNSQKAAARDGEIDEKLDELLLKQAWMKVVLMEFDPKAKPYALRHPSMARFQTPRRQQVQTPSSNSKKKKKPLFVIDHTQEELRRAIESKVWEMIEENRSLEEELKNDMIGRGQIPKQANWFYFDTGLSGGIARYPRSSNKAPKLIILTGKVGETPRQLGDVIVDGDLHAKISDLVAKDKLRAKKVNSNPVSKRQKKSGNNDKSEESE